MIEGDNCWNGFGKRNKFYLFAEMIGMEEEEYESKKRKHSSVHRWGKYQL